ncbi:fatty acyl-AMP ligase [Microbacterium caowuchunii]|nr:fatty acyl-AMP ligase [Microbacterium caowuchunii]
MNDSRTLVDGLRATARDLGDERGIRFYDSPTESTLRGYGELDRRARAIGDALAQLGFGVGDTATIGLTNGLDWADSAFGVLYAGMAFVPAPVAGYGTGAQLGERVESVSRSAEASVFITDRAVLARLGDDLPDLQLLLLDDLLADGDPENWTRPEIDGDSLAYLLSTSGSTGDPKSVIATHGNVVATASAAGALFGSDRSAVLVGWAPLHHIMGLMIQVIMPGLNGSQAVVTSPEQFQRRPVFWLQLISRHRGTVSAAGNFAFGLCTQLATDEQIAELDLSTLKTLFVASEPVRPETLNAFFDRFAPAGVTPEMVAPAMGMTEANLISGKRPGTTLVIRRFDRAALEADALVPSEDPATSVEWVSCGEPTEGTTIVIVDPDTLAPVPDGVVGEIWVSSPMVSPGYFRRPDATAETFGHTIEGRDGSFMRTGDLAAMLDGELYVTGRLKEMIIVRGRNLYPQDIEAAATSVSVAVGVGAAFELDGHPSAIGLVVEVDEEKLDAAGEDLESLVARLRETLVPRLSLPSLAIAAVGPGQLPRTATGKVRRRPTRAALEDGALMARFSVGFAPVRARTGN